MIAVQAPANPRVGSSISSARVRIAGSWRLTGPVRPIRRCASCSADRAPMSGRWNFICNAAGRRRPAAQARLRRRLAPCPGRRAEYCCHPGRRENWRSGPELNRRTRICSPLHHHSATGPIQPGHLSTGPPCRVKLRLAPSGQSPEGHRRVWVMTAARKSSSQPAGLRLTARLCVLGASRSRFSAMWRMVAMLAGP